MARLKPQDVWDLTEKAGGDHVLIALTVDECEAVIERLPHGNKKGNPASTAREQIRLSLRDQKEVE
jgi:hypothetical protein